MTTHGNVQQQKRGFPSSCFALSRSDLPPVPAQCGKLNPPDLLNTDRRPFDFSSCAGLFSRLKGGQLKGVTRCP